MRDVTDRWGADASATPEPRGVVAFVGARNLVSERIETALRDRFSFEFLDAPAPSSPTVDLVGDAARPHLYVVNCYRVLDASIVPPSKGARGRHAAAVAMEALDEWMATWTQRIAALQRYDPDVPIVVALNEQRDPELVSRAIEAGAAEVIGAAVADVPQLVQQRVRSLLRESNRELAEMLWNTAAPGTMAAPNAARPNVSGAHSRRTGAARRQTDASRPADALVETWEAPVGAAAAEGVMQRVRAALPSLPTAEQRSSAVSELLAVRGQSLRAASGRLDANRIAERLGVSVSKLAGPLGVSRQALSETPDSPKAQRALDPLARALTTLEELLPDRKAVRAWLVSPQERFDGATPQQAMLDGRAEEVAHALEMVRDGGLGA